MSNGNNGTARERLDALLTELEQETVVTEDVVEMDVAAMRSLIESAIEKHMRAETEQSVAPDRLTTAKGGVASSMEQLARLTGIGQGTVQPSAPRLRMAFSGTSDKSRRERRRGERPSREVKERNDEDD